MPLNLVYGMRNGSSRLAGLAAVLFTAAAVGQTTSDLSGAAAAGARIDAMCPDARREAEELEVRKKPTSTGAVATRPALRENLLLMERQDQEARAFLLSSGGPLRAMYRSPDTR